jgi:hypothetical protein
MWLCVGQMTKSVCVGLGSLYSDIPGISIATLTLLELSLLASQTAVSKSCAARSLILSSQDGVTANNQNLNSVYLLKEKEKHSE